MSNEPSAPATAKGAAVHRPARTRQQRRRSQLQSVVRPGRPLLEVRHLHAGRGVHSVGGLDEAGEQDRLERRWPSAMASRMASMRAPFAGG